MRILLFKRTTAFGLLSKFFNGLRPIIFFLQPSGTPQAFSPLLGAWNYWDARRAILYCLLAGDNISVFTHPPALDRLQGSLRLFVCACAVIMRWVCYESAMRFIGAPRELCSNGERRRCGALQSLTREETFVSEAISDDSCLIWLRCKITAKIWIKKR